VSRCSGLLLGKYYRRHRSAGSVIRDTHTVDCVQLFCRQVQRTPFDILIVVAFFPIAMLLRALIVPITTVGIRCPQHFVAGLAALIIALSATGDS